MTQETKEILQLERESVIFLLWDTERQKMLLERRRGKVFDDKMDGMLVVPAGKVEPQDKTGKDYYTNALVREVFEEFGIKPTAVKFLFAARHVTPNDHVYWSKVYLISAWDGEVSNVEEKHDHVWLTIDEASQVVSLPLAQLIIDYVKQVV